MASFQIIYQPDSTRTDSFCVWVDDREEYKKWLEGDESIGLARFVGRFNVYHSSQGSQGKWEVASKSQLENELSSKSEEDAIKTVLKRGEDRTAKSVGKTKESAVKNASQSGENSVSKGAMSGGHHGGR